MTTVATVPPAPGALAGIWRFRRPAAVDGNRASGLFLAPTSTADQSLVVRASDRAEKAMHRLRNPFAVMAERQTHQAGAPQPGR